MAGGIQRIAGSAIDIGLQVPYKSVVTLADFAAQTWTEIGQWQSSGDLGSEQETISQTLISQNTTLYAKGIISFPVMSNSFVPDLTDAGQIAFAAAQKSCKPYAFRIRWSADCGSESIVTITIASPGLINWTAHGLEAGTPITFGTTGTLPTGLVAGTTYFVVSPTANSFSVASTIGGTAIVTTGTQSGVQTAYAQDVGETDLFYGFAMLGVKSGGDASANRLLSLPIQPISPAVTI